MACYCGLLEIIGCFCEESYTGPDHCGFCRKITGSLAPIIRRLCICCDGGSWHHLARVFAEKSLKFLAGADEGSKCEMLFQWDRASIRSELNGEVTARIDFPRYDVKCVSEAILGACEAVYSDDFDLMEQLKGQFLRRIPPTPSGELDEVTGSCDVNFRGSLYRMELTMTSGVNGRPTGSITFSA